MNKHTTNDTNLLIEVAEDCGLLQAVVPPAKEPKTAAQIAYEMLQSAPYQYTSDEVLYEANGRRRGISREEFFSKGQPCFRASALCKRYGWGVHHNMDGKIAIYGVETPQYAQLRSDEKVKHTQAMRSKK